MVGLRTELVSRVYVVFDVIIVAQKRKHIVVDDTPAVEREAALPPYDPFDDYLELSRWRRADAVAAAMTMVATLTLLTVQRGEVVRS